MNESEFATIKLHKNNKYALKYRIQMCVQNSVQNSENSSLKSLVDSSDLVAGEYEGRFVLWT